MIDSHAHLEMLKDLPAVLDNARQAGVKQIVTIGTDLPSSRKASILAKSHQHVFHTIGLHPHDAKVSLAPGYWREFEKLVEARPPVAIGECGLDFFRNLSAADDQRKAFIRQIEIALNFKLPIVVHDRDAHQETVDMLRQYGADKVGGVLHCFSGDLGIARQVVDLGFYLGIPGVITYPQNQSLRDLVQEVPEERLLLETDCPYLTPQPLRGKKNQPAYMLHTAKALAEALNKSLEQTITITSRNTARLFNLPEA